MIEADSSFFEIARFIEGIDSKFLKKMTDETLGDAIYSIYIRSDVMGPPKSHVTQGKSFVDHLSYMNCGAGTWEAGWTVRERRNEYVVAERDNVLFRVLHSDIRVNDAAPFSKCQVKVGKEYRALNNGFYTALGDEPLTERLSVRFYWNLQPSVAARFIELVTRHFNSARLQFTVKVLSSPEFYSRADSGVLYARLVDIEEVVALVETCWIQLQPAMNVLVPLFAKQLVPGLAFALDPLNGRSFGQYICKLCAQFVLNQPIPIVLGREKIVDQLSQHFDSAGIDPTCPWLLHTDKSTAETIEKYLNHLVK